VEVARCRTGAQPTRYPCSNFFSCASGRRKPPLKCVCLVSCAVLCVCACFHARPFLI
jgi:hypothetical protein